MSIVEMINATLLLVAFALAALAGCGSGLDPAVEPGRNACHLQANLDAEARWEEQCGESRWADCPDAQEITDRLQAELEACDERAYPNE